MRYQQKMGTPGHGWQGDSGRDERGGRGGGRGEGRDGGTGGGGLGFYKPSFVEDPWRELLRS